MTKTTVNALIALLCLATAAHSQETAPGLDRARGKIYQVDFENKSMEFITLTAYDPQSDEGKTRHRVYWNDQTQFIEVNTQDNFAGLSGDYVGKFYYIEPNMEKALQAGKRFTARNVEIDENSNKPKGLQGRTLSAAFTVKGEKDALVQFDGKQVSFRLGNRSAVSFVKDVNEDFLKHELFRARIFGKMEGDRFVLRQVRLTPMPDPTESEDPNLPRMLVIGDSISGNYNKAARKALEGIVNYHRIEGNGGPTSRGVESLDLWLGNYQNPKLAWDVIQFNHGLHDLKRGRMPDGSFGQNAATLEAYKQNLEIIIDMLKDTGATIIWATTTPVPNDSNGGSARKKDEDLIYNNAALEVVSRHPEILINDLNKTVRESPVFDTWRQGDNVHFKSDEETKALAEAIVETVQRAIDQRK